MKKLTIVPIAKGLHSPGALLVNYGFVNQLNKKKCLLFALAI